VAGLVVLNLLLAGGVYLRFGGEKKADAQIGKVAMDIATVAGQSNNQSIVYIMDVNTGQLAAVKTDALNNRIERVAVRNVAADIQRLK
jgi:hypothetical protein